MDKKINHLFLEEAARGTRKLYEDGFSPSGDSGDVSVRDPETGYIYISGSPAEIEYLNLGEYHACDMVVVDIDGNKITSWSRPTCETPMHLAILRARPDMNAVVHTHATWSSIYSICGKNIPLVLNEQLEHLGGEIECAGYGMVASEELADMVVKALGNKFAALMRNHGAVAVGKTLNEAFTRAAYLEDVAQKAFFATLLGDMQIIKPSEVFHESYLGRLKHTNYKD